MIKTCLLTLFVFTLTTSFLWAGIGKNTIIKYGNRVEIYSDTHRQRLEFNKSGFSLQSISESLVTPETIIEDDQPVELHNFKTLSTIQDVNSFVIASAVTANPIIVAVLDTGIDLHNTSLAPYILVNNYETINGIDDDNNGYIDDRIGYNFYSDTNLVQDGFGHGTLISGIIAKNSQGSVKILPLKVFDDQGRSSQFLIADAIYYAVQRGAKVINCSFGYEFLAEVMRLAVQYAIDNGVMVVASAGNQGQEKEIYPAALPGVIAVSSLDGADHIANFSNYGKYLAVSCIGVDVSSTYLNNQLASVSGTSISAGYISGLIPYLMKTKNVYDSSKIISANINDIVDPLGNGLSLKGWDKYTGFGKLDASSIAPYKVAATNSEIRISSLLNYPNPIIDTNGTQLGYYLNSDSNVSIYVYDISGKQIWVNTISSGSTGGKAGYNKVAFDCRAKSGMYLPNDTYIAVVKADTGSSKNVAKTLITIAR